MTVLTDLDIANLCQGDTPLVSPYVDYDLKREQTGKISWGVSSAGYDVRLGHDFKSFKYDAIENDIEIDPKQPSDEDFNSFSYPEDGNSSFIMEPNEFLLGTTMEEFNIPSNIMGLCISRSTYARHGIICHTTPLMPGFRGQVTLEIKNTSNQNVLIYPGEGICQFIFFKMTGNAWADYAALGGKYMHQHGTTGPRA